MSHPGQVAHGILHFPAATWAFLRDSDEKLLEMADYLHAKESVDRGNVMAKITALSTGLPVPESWM